MKRNVYFITGIDTNVGKTYVTAGILKALLDKGIHAISQKMIQTGCVGISEDIEAHRQLTAMPLCEDDKTGLTCPYVFTFPCSPHLAAQIDNATIDCNKITEATQRLAEKYETVLLEGAGGLLVPITTSYSTADYIKEQNYPVILATSGKLGSINHTLLSLEYCKMRGIDVVALVYNFDKDADPVIEKDTQQLFQTYLSNNFPKAKYLTMPRVLGNTITEDVAALASICE